MKMLVILHQQYDVYNTYSLKLLRIVDVQDAVSTKLYLQNMF